MRIDRGAAFTGLVVFLANGALLVIQLVANRLLAPFIGSSLETWTAVIASIMAGISAGNAAGGWLADARAGRGTLRAVLAGGAAATLFTLGFVVALEATTAWRALSLSARIPVLAFIACFPPAFVLSLLTPLAIRIALPAVDRSGRVVGRVYALGTLGSLAGNFLTGFVLLACFSTHTIVVGIAALLAALAAATPPVAPVAPVAGQAPETPSPTGPTAAPALDTRSACAIVLVASFCSMSLEMAASRVLAPALGVSLYSWTGIIGVVLCGIAAGNWLGGVLADRLPRADVLGASLVVASLATLFVIFINEVLAKAPWQEDLPVIPRTLLWASLLFLPAMTMLGTISPQVTRLAVPDVATAGSVAGRIYAWSCAGAIAGTVVTGWWLIRIAGVLKLMFGLALVLAALGMVAGEMWRRPKDLVASALVVGAVAGMLVFQDKLKSWSLLETNYFSIYVQSEMQPDGSSIRSLVLDKLIHSMVRGWLVEENGKRVWKADPTYLGYPHEQVQAEFAVLASLARDPRVLVVGGGGYTLPRWMDGYLPGTHCDVVEIDPGVTEVAHRYLGLPPVVRFTENHLDGRQFLSEVARPGSYQLAIQDVVNDWQVPFHLMTREYFELVRRVLTPDGVFLLSVIDTWETGELYRSAFATLKAVFPHVHIVASKPSWEVQRRSVIVIYASARPLDLAANRKALAAHGSPQMLTIAYPPAREAALIDAAPKVILTDRYAPVDNLIKVHK